LGKYYDEYLKRKASRNVESSFTSVDDWREEKRKEREQSKWEAYQKKAESAPKDDKYLYGDNKPKKEKESLTEKYTEKPKDNGLLSALAGIAKQTTLGRTLTGLTDSFKHVQDNPTEKGITEGVGRALGSVVQMGSKPLGDMVEGAYTPDRPTNERSFMNQTGASMRAGVGDTFKMVGSGMDWLENRDGKDGLLGKTGRKITSAGERMIEGYEPSYNKEFEAKDILDPNFYSTKVARTIPNMASSFIPGIGVGLGTAKLATTMGLKGFGKGALSFVAGGLTNASSDAFMETGSNYEEALKRGMTQEEASQVGDEVFKNNMLLNSGLDVAQLAVGATPLGKLSKMVGKAGNIGLRAGAGAGIEAFQEGYQTKIGADALGDDFSWSDPSTIEAMFIGGLLGGTMTGGMAGYQDIREQIHTRTLERLPEQVRNRYNEAYDNSRRLGMTDEDARDFAADLVMDSPETTRAIKEATEEILSSLQQEASQKQSAESQVRNVLDQDRLRSDLNGALENVMKASGVNLNTRYNPANDVQATYQAPTQQTEPPIQQAESPTVAEQLKRQEEVNREIQARNEQIDQIVNEQTPEVPVEQKAKKPTTNPKTEASTIDEQLQRQEQLNQEIQKRNEQIDQVANQADQLNPMPKQPKNKEEAKQAVKDFFGGGQSKDAIKRSIQQRLDDTGATVEEMIEAHEEQALNWSKEQIDAMYEMAGKERPEETVDKSEDAQVTKKQNQQNNYRVQTFEKAREAKETLNTNETFAATHKTEDGREIEAVEFQTEDGKSHVVFRYEGQKPLGPFPKEQFLKTRTQVNHPSNETQEENEEVEQEEANEVSKRSDDYQIFNVDDEVQWIDDKGVSHSGVVRGHGWDATNPDTDRPADTIVVQEQGKKGNTTVRARMIRRNQEQNPSSNFENEGNETPKTTKQDKYEKAGKITYKFTEEITKAGVNRIIVPLKDGKVVFNVTRKSEATHPNQVGKITDRSTKITENGKTKWGSSVEKALGFPTGVLIEKEELIKALNGEEYSYVSREEMKKRMEKQTEEHLKKHKGKPFEVLHTIAEQYKNEPFKATHQIIDAKTKKPKGAPVQVIPFKATSNNNEKEFVAFRKEKTGFNHQLAQEFFKTAIPIGEYLEKQSVKPLGIIDESTTLPKVDYKETKTQIKATFQTVERFGRSEEKTLAFPKSKDGKGYNNHLRLPKGVSVSDINDWMNIEFYAEGVTAEELTATFDLMNKKSTPKETTQKQPENTKSTKKGNSSSEILASNLKNIKDYWNDPKKRSFFTDNKWYFGTAKYLDGFIEASGINLSEFGTPTEIETAIMENYKEKGKVLGEQIQKKVIEEFDKKHNFNTKPTTNKQEPKKETKSTKPSNKYDKLRDRKDFIKQARKAADKRLADRHKNNTTLYAGLPMNDILDYAIVGMDILTDKMIDKAEFTEEIVKLYGEKLRRWGGTIYASANDLLEMTEDDLNEMLQDAYGDENITALDTTEEVVEEKAEEKPTLKTKEAFKEDYEKEFNNYLNAHVEYLKESGGKGVEQGNVIKNEQGEISGRYGRISKNPQWYQVFYKENGRKPNNREYNQLALDHLLNGFGDEFGQISAWTPDVIHHLEEEERNLEKILEVSENEDSRRLFNETRDELATARVAFREFKNEKKDLLSKEEKKAPAAESKPTEETTNESPTKNTYSFMGQELEIVETVDTRDNKTPIWTAKPVGNVEDWTTFRRRMGQMGGRYYGRGNATIKGKFVFKKPPYDSLDIIDNQVENRGETNERPVDGGKPLENKQEGNVSTTESGRETSSDTREGSNEVRGNDRRSDSKNRENVSTERERELSRQSETQGKRQKPSNGSSEAGTLPTRLKTDFEITTQLNEKRGPKKRFDDNIQALETLLTIEKEGRMATKEEQEILVKYVGWGGLKEAFEEGKPQYEKLKAFVKEGRITEEEYSEMFDTLNSSFFTPPAIINGMYNVLEKLGFRSGNILEPSVGTGNFIGLMPQNVKENSNVIGIEKDSITSRIAKQLYQNAKIHHTPFEDFKRVSDGYFDIAIGNVPYVNVGVSDKSYKGKMKFVTDKIHDYFFIKSLDRVRDGGIVAFVTTKGTLDKKGAEIRNLIGEKADFLGAVRLPEDAFQSANTGVVSDIIFLQKRAEGKEANHTDAFFQTKTKKVDGKSFGFNEYFFKHPEMVVGSFKATTDQHGDALTVQLNGDFESSLQKALNNLPSDLYKERSEQILEDYSDQLAYDIQDQTEGTIIEKNGAFFQVEEGQLKPYTPAKGKEKRLKGMLRVRGAVENLLKLEQTSDNEQDVEAARKKLNREYDLFTKTYGYINEKVNLDAMKDDSLSLALVSSLEDYKESGTKKAKTYKNSAKKEQIFTKRVLEKAKPVEKVDTAHEALALSLYQFANVNMEYMAKLSNRSIEQLEKELGDAIYFDPQLQKHVTSDEYLSGNIRKKLAHVQGLKGYERHAKALEEVLPSWLELQNDRSLSPITVNIGSHWIPTQYYERFIKEVLDATVKIKHHLVDGSWFMSTMSTWNYANREDWGVKSQHGKQVLGTDIVHDLLNNKDIKVTYTEDGKSYVDEQATLVAKNKAEMLQNEFQNWLASDSSRVEHLESIYNNTFNAVKLRNYNGEVLYGTDQKEVTIPKLNKKFKMMKHQKDAIYRVVQGKNTLLAHVVGAGKTLEMVVSGMEGKRLGMWKKPMYVVPKPLLDQWEKEFKEAYPTAKILKISNDGSSNIPTVKPPKKKGTSDKAYQGIREANRLNRYKALNKIRYGEYDAILITHGTFQRLPVSPETEQAFIREQMEDLARSIREAHAENEPQSVKRLQKSLQALEKKLKDNVNEEIQDVGIPFEELGIDQIFVDEAHMFKNLMFSSKMNNVAGLPRNYSQRAQDMFMKTKWLTETNNGRGVVFATGTPIANSVAELYTMIRYLDLPRLKELGIDHFDSWASMFGKITSDMEMDATGAYKEKTRFASFHNLPELSKIFKAFADVKTADDLTYLDKPSKVERIIVEAEMSKDQEVYLADLQKRAQAVKGGQVDKTEDNHLKISGDGRKNALDGRLVQSDIDDFKGSKINLAVENIAEVYHDTKETRKDKKGEDINNLAQLVFLDLGTPKRQNNKDTDGDVEEENELEFEQKLTDSVYQDLKNKLIRKKIKPSEIAFIHDAKTDKQRLELFQKVRDGEVRVLIGSTEKMGAGMNVQDRLVALHHLDAPWRPADIEQREGRIIRQKNRLDHVKIYSYITVGSFDAISWNTLQKKAKFINQVMTGGDDVRSVEDIDEIVEDYTNLAVAASGNPLMEELVKVQKEVKSLNASKQDFLRKRRNAQMEVQEIPERITRFKKELKEREEDVKTIQEAEAKIKERVEKTIQSSIKTFEEEGKTVTRLPDALEVREKDSKRTKKHSFPEEFAITLKGKEYTVRKEASEELKDLVILSELGEKIGAYLGLDLYVESEGLRLKGKHEYKVKLDLDKPDGFITRLQNVAFTEPFDERDWAERYIPTLESDLEGAKKAAKESFKNEKELDSLLKREEEITKELKGDNKEEAKASEKTETNNKSVADELSDRVNARRRGTSQEGFVSFGFSRRSTNENRPYKLQDEDVQKRIDASEDIPKKPKTLVIKEWLKRQQIRITREFEHLPNTGDFSELRHRLLQLEKQRGVAMEKTADFLDGLLIGFDRNQYELFRNMVLLADLMEEKNANHKLPFGLDESTLEREYARQKKFLEKEDDVKEAIKLREKLWGEIKREYIKTFDEIGVNVKDKFNKKDYYRHIVIEKAQERKTEKMSGNKKLQTPKGKGYMRQREGSELDIVSDYLFAESEVMSNMLFDIEVAKTIVLVDKIHNIEPKLKKEVDAANKRSFAILVQDDIAGETSERIENIVEAYASEYNVKLSGKESGIEAVINKFRGNIGYANSRLRELAESNELWEGHKKEHKDIVKSIVEKENHPLYFEYLSDLATTDEDGAMQARTILKYTSLQKKFRRELLGKKYKTIENSIPEGYDIWQPDKGNVFFMANTLPDSKAQLLFSGLMDEITEGDFTKQLVLGGKNKGFIVPTEVSQTLDNLMEEHGKGFETTKMLMRKLKSVLLVGPVNIFKYNARNMTGDLDKTVAGNPKGLKYIPRAYTDLSEIFIYNRKPSTELQEWLKRGGIQTLVQSQEFGEIKHLHVFKDKMIQKEMTALAKTMNLPKKVWNGYWAFARKATDFRESLLRYANYLSYLEQINKTGVPKNYGASIREEIDALENEYDKAFNLSNDLLIAYDKTSATGRVLRDTWFPFWSFIEGNMRSYVRLFKNAYQDEELVSLVGRKMLGKAVAQSPRLAYKTGKLVMGVSFVTVLLSIWNNLFFDDEEEELPEHVRNSVHIVFGRNKDGEILYFNRLGTLSDFLEWFGLNNIDEEVKAVLNNDKTFFEALGATTIKPVNKLYQAVNPLAKQTVEQALGLKTFPDVTEPSRINDRLEHFMSMLTVNKEYAALRDELIGRPHKEHKMQNYFLYATDAEESNYYNVRDMVRKDAKKYLGKDTGNFIGTKNPKSEVLYEVKLGMKYGDFDYARQKLKEYALLGGTEQGFKQSLNALDPLKDIPKGMRTSYFEQLSEKDKEKVKRAYEFYNQTLLGKKYQE
jgi:N12 class adenine-specific DNA methylase